MGHKTLGWADRSGQERTTIFCDMESIILPTQPKLCWVFFFFFWSSSHHTVGFFYTCRHLKPPDAIPCTSENLCLLNPYWSNFLFRCGHRTLWMTFKILGSYHLHWAERRGELFPSLQLLSLYLKLFTQRKWTGHWEAEQPNKISHKKERVASTTGVNVSLVSAGIATCSLLAPWGFSDPAAPADLGREAFSPRLWL